MKQDFLKYLIKRALNEQLELLPEPEVEKPKPAPKKTTTPSTTKKTTPPATTKKPTTPPAPKKTEKEKEREKVIADIYDEIGDDSSGSGTSSLIVGLVAAGIVLGGGALLKSYLAKKGIKGFGSLYKVLGKNVDKLKKITPSELNQFERYIDAELQAGNITKAEHAELKKIVRSEVLASFRNKMVSEKFFQDFSAGRMSYDDFIAGSPEIFARNPTYQRTARNYYDDVIVPFYGEVESTRAGSARFPRPDVMRAAGGMELGRVRLHPRGEWSQIKGTGFNQGGIDYVYLDAGVPIDGRYYENNILERLNKPVGDSNGLYIPTEYLDGGLPSLNEFKQDLIRLGGNANLQDDMYRLIYNRYKMLIELNKYQ